MSQVGWIVVILAVILLLGGIGPWAPRGYGYGFGHNSMGVLGVVLIVVLVLLLLGRL